MDLRLGKIGLSTLIRLMLLEDGSSILDNSRRANLTYGYSWDTYKYLQKCDLITIEKVGRKNILKLTERGKLISGLLKQINDSLV